MHSPSARALLAAVVDYAGLFPPAALSMPEAVAEYAAAQRGSDAWMLGRFVLTAARLPEFAEVMASTAAPAGHWRLSAIVRDGSQIDRDAVSLLSTPRPRVITPSLTPSSASRRRWKASTGWRRSLDRPSTSTSR